jgi:hypothetical protein
MPVHRDEDLHTKHRGEQHGKPARPGHRPVYPTSFLKPRPSRMCAFLFTAKCYEPARIFASQDTVAVIRPKRRWRV